MKEVVKTSVSSFGNLILEMYGDALKPTLKVVGTALGDFASLCLVPATGFGYLSQAAKIYMKKHLENFEKKLNKIPEEKRTVIHSQISVPIFRNLEYTTNDVIAELYLNLLCSSANLDLCKNCHPSFINIISQLSPDEAKIIQYLKDEDIIPYMEVKAYFDDDVDDTRNRYQIIDPKSTLLSFRIKFDYPENLMIYYSNLIRLGIIEDKRGQFCTLDNDYLEIFLRYNFRRYIRSTVKLYEYRFKKVGFIKSYYKVTPLGKQFIAACLG